ncbi:MAG: aspartate aminotransferase [Rhizobiales bacterium NRL2]|jgi:aspartate/methionine/tyrosine aminotransferase|nr:MAG: aspartate aminotransferase [Rhizobiales bacterium NRL2]
MSRTPPEVRDLIRDLPDSQIREVALDYIGKPGLIALWFGESDEETPDFIRDAAKAALDAGETFYAPNAGIGPLRAEIQAYMTRIYGRDFARDRFTVTASGMNAIMLAFQALVDPGDNVLVISPVWPNCAETVKILSGEVRRVLLDERDGRWSLDLDRLFDAADERTKAVFINSPGNPTGWMMSEAERDAIMEWARRKGIWLIADDVYARLVYDRHHAPSFVEVADPDDRVIAINSFSKSWSMTGWRLGWITAPASIGGALAKLNEYNMAAPTTFVQHAGVAALHDGDPYVDGLAERLHRRRDLITQSLGRFSRVRYTPPDAAFYAFFAVEGMAEGSLAFCRRLRDEAGVGLAPGSAFGPGGEGYLRLCFASSEAALSQAMERLQPYLD